MPDIVLQICIIITTPLTGLMIFILNRYHERNKDVLAHIDDCLDDLKHAVAEVKEEVAELKGWRSGRDWRR